jgi:hypothetical protein
VLLIGASAVAMAVGRRAAAAGILAPLVVGVALRLVVMLVAHMGSVSLGDHGIFYLDDQTYLHGATVLADNWRAGHTPDPARYNVLGTYQFGYQTFLAAIFTLGAPSILLGKLANVLLGGVTVYLVGRLGGQLLGDRGKIRAAWVAALAPSLVWWSAPLMKEALSTTLLVLGALAVTALPQRRALVTLGVVLAALTVVRAPAALALMVGAGVAVAIAGRRAEARVLSRPLIVFGSALVAGSIAIVVAVSHGNIRGFYAQYQFVIPRMFHRYQGGNLAHVPFDMVKSLVTPVPWTFNSATGNWDRMLYPGVWLLICALPLAAAGVWRLRRSLEGWGIIAIALTALMINAVTAGFVFRQRSMIEPLILLLALAGTTSWRMAARSAAATLGVVAVTAGVQSRSPLVAVAIAAAAGGLFLVSRRLPSRPFEPLPDSAMVAAFRRSIESDPPSTSSTPRRVFGEIGRMLRAIGVAVADTRAAAVQAMSTTMRAPSAASPGFPARTVAAGLAGLRRSAPTLEGDRPAPNGGLAGSVLAATRRARAAVTRVAPRLDGSPRPDRNGSR